MKFYMNWGVGETGDGGGRGQGKGGLGMGGGSRPAHDLQEERRVELI